MRKAVRNIISLICLLWLSSSAVAQGKYDLTELGKLSPDSLKELEKTMPLDTNKLRVISFIAHNEDNIDSIYAYSNKLYELSAQTGSELFETQALISMQYCEYMLGNFSRSIELGYKALDKADDTNKKGKQQKAKILQLIGIVYAMTLNTTKADQFFHSALEYFRELGDTLNTIYTLSNLADNHIENAMYDEATACYKEALSLSNEYNDQEMISLSLLGLGSLKYEAYRNEIAIEENVALLDSAIQLLQEAYRTTEDVETEIQISSLLVPAMIDGAGRNEKNITVLDSCGMILKKEYELIEKSGITTLYPYADLGRLKLMIAKHELKKAEALADSLNTIYTEDTETYGEHLSNLYDLYATLCTASGRNDKALKYSSLARYWQLKMRSNTYATTATQSIAQAQFDEERRAREIEVKQNEVRLEDEKKLQMFISIAAIIVLMLVGRSYYYSRKHNKVLDQKNSELESKNEEIAHQSEIIQIAHKEITDSINYACNIQQAAMPTEEQLKKLLGDYMLFYRPLNIVSGDYYWATNVGHLKMVVAADCTGHGVPGAFVSMLGISILNDIAAHVNPERISAAGILDEMRATFKQMLKQNGNEEDNRDGMDLALIIIDEEKSEIHYAGAFRPLIFIHKGELRKIDADRMPIGSHLLDQKPFTNNVIPYVHGDTCYIFSDGITDQFGYDASGNIKKFTAKRLNNLLSEISSMPFDIQKQKIAEAVDNWRSGNGSISPAYEQTDDNIIVGIRL